MEEWEGVAEQVWEIVGKPNNYSWDIGKSARKSFKNLTSKDTCEKIFSEKSSVDINRLIRNELSRRLSQRETAIDTANWIIKEWGGIKRGNSKTIENWVDDLGDCSKDKVNIFVKKNGKQRISSWSKILSFADCTTYAVYDSRTSVCLNLALGSFGDERRFYMPETQNKIIKLARTRLLANHKSGWLGYFSYLSLLSALQAIGEMNSLLDVEMRVFGNAVAVARKMDRINFVVAIDGPAGAGKGTLARRLADYYHLAHLDTGLTYRAVAHKLLTKGWPLDDEQHAIEAARLADLSALDRSVLSAHAVGEAASRVAVIPQVRRILVEKQRAFARQPSGAVVDGRDIGTVVCPEADVKLYVTASAEVRARRRLAEIEENGGTGDFETILADITRRDERDTGRADSPLKPAGDAHLLDTSQMDIETAFLAAKSLIDEVLAKRGKS